MLQHHTKAAINRAKESVEWKKHRPSRHCEPHLRIMHKTVQQYNTDIRFQASMNFPLFLESSSNRSESEMRKSSVFAIGVRIFRELRYPPHVEG